MEAIVLNQEIVNKFKKMPTAQLMIKAAKMVGEEKEVAISLLKARGQDVARFETPKNTFVAEPEEELSAEEQAMLDEAEKGMEPLKKSPKTKKEKVVKEKVIKEKKVREPREKKEKVAREPKETQDIILEESEEVPGLKVGVTVKFKPASNKKSTEKEELSGEVTRVYKCHRAEFKEYCKIKVGAEIFHKRSKSLEVI